MIEDARAAVSQTINVGLTLMYWNIGKRINEEVLKQERAEYGKAIVATMSQQLTEEYGNGYAEKSLQRMIQFYECFPDSEIVATLSRQLSWSHFKEIMYLEPDLAVDFYAECAALSDGVCAHCGKNTLHALRAHCHVHHQTCPKTC